ncbi:serine hydrolase domain-containing protein [Granulicoccus sp. GXG6511]|uniref:serine hydrolase domain-containing protein n=1 Tax=Granulicoccus sp. GXG6511 TaxID=3381351 RepID=UPI003D7EC1CB
MQLSFWTDPDRDFEDPIGRRRRIILTLVIAALVGFLLSGVWGPGITLGRGQTGDPALAEDVLDHLRSNAGFETIAVVTLDPGGARQARLGPDEGSHWELGSITKTFTAQVLADAVDRDEVRLEDTLAQHLPELAGSEVGAVTLGELATHRAGVPRLLPSESRRAPLAALTLRDPYRATTPELLQEARAVALERPGEYAYSNLGADLLGHALARATGHADWTSTVHTRLLEPLGMRDTVFAATPDELPANRVQGHQTNGRRPQAWAAEGGLPGGVSTWITVADFRRYAEALLAGTAPGMTALDPIADVGDEGRIGLFWQISPGPENQQLTWHNGGTFGASSILLLDRDADKAVLVLNNTSTSVDRLGAGLIADDKPPQPLPGVLEIVALAVMALGAWWVTRRARAATRRAELISAALDLITIALLTAMIGAWFTVPGWLHGVALGLGMGGLLLSVRGAERLPLYGSRPTADKVQVAVSGLLLLVVIGLRLV